MAHKESQHTNEFSKKSRNITLSSSRRAEQTNWEFETDDTKREKLLKKLEENFFLRFTGAVTSAITVFHNLSPITNNPVAFLRNTKNSSMNSMFFQRLGFDIAMIDEKDITKDQYDKTVEFLTNGVENTLSQLLCPKKLLDGQESLAVEKFKSMKTVDGNCYTIHGLRKLLEKHFSITNVGNEKNIEGVIYKRCDVKTRTYKKRGLNGGRKVDLQTFEKALRLEKSKLNHSAISERLGVSISTIERWKSKFVFDENENVVQKPKIDK